ncbi:MAG TPA: hypothetical protein VGD29_00510 [Actinoplanes sp.]|jgi:hypothetical protein
MPAATVPVGAPSFQVSRANGSSSAVITCSRAGPAATPTSWPTVHRGQGTTVVCRPLNGYEATVVGDRVFTSDRRPARHQAGDFKGRAAAPKALRRR